MHGQRLRLCVCHLDCWSPLQQIRSDARSRVRIGDHADALGPASSPPLPEMESFDPLWGRSLVLTHTLFDWGEDTGGTSRIR